MALRSRIIEQAYLHPRLYYLMHMSYLSPLVWREITRWQRAGRPAPPPGVVKRHVIWSHAKRFKLKTLVETGTYKGDTVAALLHKFEDVFSVELSPVLYEQARRRFEDAEHAHLICGDSGVELAKIVQQLDRPAVFWLDGHWCGGQTAQGDTDTPVLKELTCVLDAAALGHVILIDDARLFGVDPQYPSVEELRVVVMSKRPNMEFSVRDDIVRVTP